MSINALNEVNRRAADAVEAGTFDRRTDRTLITLRGALQDKLKIAREMDELRVQLPSGTRVPFYAPVS